MIPANGLAPALSQGQGSLLLLAVLGLSLVLIFAGRKLVKVVAFLVAGLVGAAIGGALGALFLNSGLALIGVLIGFVLGGLLGVVLISLGIGLAVGYAGYLIVLGLAGSSTIAAVAGLVFFIVGLALASKILTLATAVAGGLLLFNVLAYFGFSPIVSTLIAAATTLIGLWVQTAHNKRMTQPASTNLGGQPNNPK